MHNKMRFWENVSGYLFILPALVIMSIFVFWPVGYSFYLSFFNWDYAHLKNPSFIGLQNYIQLFELNTPPPYSFLKALVFDGFYISVTFLALFSIYILIEWLKSKKFRILEEIYVLITVLSLAFFDKILSALNAIPYIVLIFLGLAAGLVVFRKSRFISRMAGHLFTLFLISGAIYLTLRFAFPSNYGIYQWLDAVKESSDFIKSIWNTAYYVILYVPADIILALLVALLLNRLKLFKAILRTSYFMPFVTSIVAISLVWQWLYNDQYGLINYLLSLIGISPIAWLKSDVWTIPTIAIMSVWKTIGYNAIIFLAGLQSIDRSYYEAADIDGATTSQKLWYITWPLLSPMTFFVLIVSVIGAFKVFTEVYVLYQAVPGPYNNSGLTIVYYIFQTFYTNQQMGLASAAAYILFAIILVFTLIQFRVGQKRVEYL
ncbi:MAG: sugar ABC transporter permease [Mesoaciditoga sp.]|uniref:carbohydrate ABC transporter permease n=1 Tax=Athalassotoga sp. TaxID=2022597 RepID=UPI000CC0E1E1|nr:MAG: sugar ABC transporter permease [Mesoaciditoga sp.]PMP80596.1 MAG: sugar ABC transporter permease [Mesoaciditoga sp.]HEU23763.1 sugar ABC transporter permease [Mesoaciditoga lauensis]